MIDPFLVLNSISPSSLSKAILTNDQLVGACAFQEYSAVAEVLAESIVAAESFWHATVRYLNSFDRTLFLHSSCTRLCLLCVILRVRALGCCVVCLCRVVCVRAPVTERHAVTQRAWEKTAEVGGMAMANPYVASAVTTVTEGVELANTIYAQTLELIQEKRRGLDSFSASSSTSTSADADADAESHNSVVVAVHTNDDDLHHEQQQEQQQQASAEPEALALDIQVNP
jgi:hypothetical protein